MKKKKKIMKKKRKILDHYIFPFLIYIINSIIRFIINIKINN